MGKRKQSAPNRATEDKRKCLTWNMVEGRLETGSVTLIPDNDPSLLEEAAQTKLPNSAEKPDKSSSHTCSEGLPEFISKQLMTAFEENLKTCLFCFNIRCEPDFKPSEWNAQLGKFIIQVHPHEQWPNLLQNSLPKCPECWFYVTDKKGSCMLYFELNESKEKEVTEGSSDKVCSTIYFFSDTSFPIECLETLQIKRIFRPTLTGFNQDTLQAEITIYITAKALKELHYASEYKKPQRDESAIQTLMEEFHGIFIPSYKGSGRTSWHDVDLLYSSIKQSRQLPDKEGRLNVQHPNLKPCLRPYQREAVQWMLQREGCAVNKENLTNNSASDKLHQLYQEIETLDHQTLYYNCYTGCLVEQKPVSVKPLPGGILADEMGLGKTVEVLACMLGHPRQALPPVEPLPVVEIIQDDEQSDSGPSEEVVLKREDTFSNDMTDVARVTNSNKAIDNSVEITKVENQHLMCEKGKFIDEMGDVRTAIIDRDSDDLVVNEMDRNAHADIDQGVHVPCNSGDYNMTDTEDKKPSSFMPPSVTGDKIGLCVTDVNNKSNVNNSDEMRDVNILENVQSCDSLQLPDGSDIVVDSKEEKMDKIADDICSEEYSDISDLPTEDENTKPNTESVENSAKLTVKEVTEKDSEKISSNNRECCENSSVAKQTKRMKKPRKKYGELVPIDQLEPSPNGFFSDKPIGPKEYFECICGRKDTIYRYTNFQDQHTMKVQCTQCGLWQHSTCVNYDLQNPYRGSFLCPHCHVVAAPIPSGATLIVSPNSICHQWVEEITKHIKEKSIKVFVYTGVTKLGFMQPRTLASYDIVITTYETLRKEIDFVDLPHGNSDAGRRFRHPKRFMAIPSPLIAVQWWRICLDEAQMVEGVTTRTAEMPLRLSAVNRWCVTGTPVQKGIQDLFGLLVFLGEDPFCVRGWWNKLLYEPLKHGIHEPLYEAIGKVLWRTAKKDVIDQIQLPGQSEQVKWLTFSPVEDHFYRRQYHTCMREAARTLLRRTDAETKLTSLDRHTLNSILYPLLSLRQACCHPQAVRGAFLPLQKSTMTMEELLESLTKKATLECEEAHRQLVAALNGLAGLDILKGKYADAVENYREVFRSIDEHKNRFRTDDLQQLHALHNLREVLNLKPAGVSPTLRDDQLAIQSEELREKYMVKVGGKLSSREETLHPAQENLHELKKEFRGGANWWIDLLQWVTYIHQEEPLLERIQEHLRETVNPEIPTIANRFRDIRGLEYILDGHLRDLQKSHDKLISAIQRLRKKPSPAVIDLTAECCLRPQDKILKTCPYCKADELFSEYESKLFSISEKGVFADEDEPGTAQVNTKRQGNWADSELEKSLKTILSFVKMFKADEDLIAYGTTHIKLFEAQKKEFKALRGVWLALHETISNIDELSMATTRLRCRLPEEPKTDPPQRNVIEPSETEHHRMRLLSDRTVGQNELRKKLGQLLYLKNLAKNQGEVGGGSNPEPCPVCQRELGEEWSVLQCGHCYCLDCIRIMVDEYSFGGRLKSLRCAMCRQLTRHTDISNVSTKANTNLEEGEEAISVKGSHSTKVEAVVRSLKQIHISDPTAKSLVFSTWTDVLDKISQALLENDISHRCLHGGRKFQQNLHTFRHDNSIRALLLPVHSGANGLNLIEATHVLLVEPILNLGEEQQAIGRVHRIGQTKPIKVVRFLVRGTIEEKMYSMFKTMSRDHDDWEENSITVGDVITLLKEVQEQDGNHDDREGSIPLNEEVSSTEINQEESVGSGESMNSEPVPGTSQDFPQPSSSADYVDRFASNISPSDDIVIEESVIHCASNNDDVVINNIQADDNVVVVDVNSVTKPGDAVVVESLTEIVNDDNVVNDVIQPDEDDDVSNFDQSDDDITVVNITQPDDVVMDDVIQPDDVVIDGVIQPDAIVVVNDGDSDDVVWIEP